jgi:hypothetical protein
VRREEKRREEERREEKRREDKEREEKKSLANTHIRTSGTGISSHQYKNTHTRDDKQTIK